jgi:AAA15 family ATPase/GTPase
MCVQKSIYDSWRKIATNSSTFCIICTKKGIIGMLITYKVSNFRSIKEEILFSMIADAGKSNPDNIVEINLANETTLRLFKSSVIYGANASGKSNLIRALYVINQLVLTSADNKADDSIALYDPFLFNKQTEASPCKFEIVFAIRDDEGEKYTKYRYEIEFTKDEILTENLDYFPKGSSHNLFKREKTDKIFDTGKLGKSLNYKEYTLFKNQLLLSKFGKDFQNDILSRVYLYFKTFEVWNVLDSFRIDRLKDKVMADLRADEAGKVLKRLNKLLKIADTKIESIQTKESSESDFKFPKDFPEDLRKLVIGQNKTRILAEHYVYHNDEKVDSYHLPFSQESAGTNALFALGGLILKKLDSGGAIIFDEFNNSLHPKLSKFLVRLFNNPVANPKNTQLIFATHEVTLLDNEVFRKDQIWITDKDNFGATDLYSIKENCNVRDDMPFDKWYMSGKLGGQPKIKEIEFIFGDE